MKASRGAAISFITIVVGSFSSKSSTAFFAAATAASADLAGLSELARKNFMSSARWAGVRLPGSVAKIFFKDSGTCAPPSSFAKPGASEVAESRMRPMECWPLALCSKRTVSVASAGTDTARSARNIALSGSLRVGPSTAQPLPPFASTTRPTS